VCASCTPSRVKPEANINVSGTVQRVGGKAVPGARLALTREGDVGDVILTVATIGFACLDRVAGPAICLDARFTKTGANGAFTYKLKGKDTQSTFGASAVLSVTTSLDAKPNEARGSSTTYRFHVQTEKLNLPVRLWEPAFDARTGAFGARVTFARLPAGLAPSAVGQGAFGYTAEFARGTEIVWRIGHARPGEVFDPRVLEDSTGTMRVIASASDLHVSETLGDQIAIALRSGARSYESPLDPPVSRGKPCSVTDDKGHRYPQTPCRLTDGTFSERFNPTVCGGESGCVEPRHGEAIVDLERRTAVSLIVIRGCEPSCRVETSLDGRSWRLVSFVTEGEAAALPLTTARAARYVRVGSSADALTEVSVWSGHPSLPVGSLLVAPQRFPVGQGTGVAGPPAVRSKGSGVSVWALVATGLLGLVAGAVGFALIKRRRGAV